MSSLTNLSAAPGRLSCLAALLVLLLLAGAGTARASDGCDIRFKQLSNLVVSGGYDPFGGGDFQTERFSVKNNGDSPCAFMIGADDGDSGAAQQRRMQDGGYLVYELWTSPNRTQRLTDYTGPPAGMMAGTIAANSEVDLEFAWTVATGQLVPAGDYRDRVTFTLYQATGSQPGRVMDTQNVQVRAKVRSAAATSITIGGVRQALAGARGTLDFGSLSNGASRSFSLEVTGNSSYSVTLESENGGVFSGPQGSTVPYTLTVDGLRVANARNVYLNYNASQTQHSVTVTVGEIGRALAGSYQDNLILTVSSD